MNYYKDTEGNLYADPASTEGLEEVLSPVRADGTVLPNHKNIGQLALQEDGTRYPYYLEEPVDGVYQPDEEKIQEVEIEAILQSMSDTIQTYLDDTAKTRKYDGILSLCSYATDSREKYRLEGQAGVDLRSGCWEYGEQVVADVIAGERTIPTEEELLSELPTIDW